MLVCTTLFVLKQQGRKYSKVLLLTNYGLTVTKSSKRWCMARVTIETNAARRQQKRNKKKARTFTNFYIGIVYF